MIVGVIPTLIIVGVVVFVLIPKWKRQMGDQKAPETEQIVKKTYIYKGAEYTAEQLKAIGINPKTGKPIETEEPAAPAPSRLFAGLVACGRIASSPSP